MPHQARPPAIGQAPAGHLRGPAPGQARRARRHARNPNGPFMYGVPVAKKRLLDCKTCSRIPHSLHDIRSPPAARAAIPDGRAHRPARPPVTYGGRVAGRRGAAAGPGAARSDDAGRARRRGAARELGLAAADRAGRHPAPGRAGLDVRRPRAGHRRAGGAVRALLPLRAGQRAPLLQLPAAVYGRDAGHGAVRQPAAADGVLGADQHQFVPADRLLVASQGRTRRRAHGLRRHRRRRAGAARRRAADRARRRQLRPGRGAGLRRADPQQPAVSVGAAAGAGRHLHQERPVPLPLLAAARHGRADAGVGLPAFGDDGEGRRVPAGAAASGAGRQRAVLLPGQRHRCGHPADRRLERDLPA